MSSLENQMIKVIQDANKRNTQGYDTTAEVKRVDGKIAYVHIPGGIDETPVDMNIVSKVGDIVQVRIANGRGWITGNLTSPPTDNTVANIAINKADTARLNVDINAESLATTQEDLKNTTNTLTKFMKDIYDLIYPVGSYYWTGDESFDPNENFSGEWTKVQDTFIYASGVHKIGDNGGDIKITLPPHAHTFTGETVNARRTYADENIGGSDIALYLDHTHKFAYNSKYGLTTNGDGVVRRTIKNGTGSNMIAYGPTNNNTTSNDNITRKTETGFIDESSLDDNCGINYSNLYNEIQYHHHSFTGTTNTAGEGKEENNMPPYIVANCWYRTA